MSHHALLPAFLTPFLALACASTDEDELPPPPKLVVVVSIDQLTPVALERLTPHLEGGLARFQQEGRRFESAYLDYALTETGPGHVSLSTGCRPRTHGVVANSWWSHEAQDSRYCVGDPEAALVRGADSSHGKPGSGRSPRNVERPTLAEHVRAAAPGSRSVSIAGKDRAAVGMGGRADVVLWWDRSKGGFATSTFYASRLPAWVESWNGSWQADLQRGPFREGWLDERAGALPNELGLVDERPGEGGRTFPYELPTLSEPPSKGELGALASFAYGSALGDHLTVDLALRAVVALDLGADDVPDVLTVGLSANDVVGHRCGPASRENADLLLRADAELGRLFDALDQRIGADAWCAVLTADHGVLPLPETMAAAGESARRVPTPEFLPVLATAKGALQDRFGTTLKMDGDGRGVRFSREEAGAEGVDLVEAREEVAAVLLAEGEAFIARAFTWDQLADAANTESIEDPLLALSARSFHPDRTPDVSIVVQPGMLLGMTSGTSHGSPHDYDRHVPLVFLGPAFEAGVEATSAATIDVVPTLLEVMALPELQAMDGRVLPRR